MSGLGYVNKRTRKGVLPLLTVPAPVSSLMEQRLTFLNPFIIISELHSETGTVFSSSVVDIIFLNVLILHSRDFVLCDGFRLYGFCEWHIKTYKRKPKCWDNINILPDTLINVRM